MKNKEHIEYTYKHRKVVMLLAEKYFKHNEEILNRVKYHDLDKLFMYLFYDKKNISQIHRNIISHHDNNLEKKYIDYVEMILDWESARYTKPDKPLNAYDTLYKYYPQMVDEILPILRKMKIDKSNMPMDEEIIKHLKKLNQVTLEDVKNEMKNYLDSLMK